MKVFQFYFNPRPFRLADNFVRQYSLLKWLFKPKGFSVFESFYYSPVNKEERKMGQLFVVGEIKNALPENKRLLKEIAQAAKNEYFRGKGHFEKSLEKVNSFLRKVKKQPEDLSLAIFGLSEDLSSTFSKIGDLKIFVFRENGVFNIGDNASFNSSSTRKFSSTMEGNLNNGDKLLILNKDLFSQLWDNKFFERLKDIKSPQELKDFFKRKKETLSQFSGVLLFVFVKKQKRRFNFNLPKIPFPKIHFFNKRIEKGVISLLFLVVLLILGYLIFK